MVSFADTASKDAQLITSLSDLKAAVNALTADGSTNHADAFTKASELLAGSTNPGATEIVLTDQVASCFRITSVAMPTKGTASLLGTNTVQWKINELGVTQSEGAVLEFTVEHIGPCSGTVEVNESVTYSDAEDNMVTFPEPEVALAAILNEVDENGVEYKPGMKTMVIPAHSRPTCRDVLVRCIKFVLPESLDVSGTADSICNTRDFKARFIAHYVDHDFECCDTVL